ncbi:MAG: prevent-host-death protein [Microbacteriaceae bacterium]|nr:prevent-host-death protein [Microbacteriaceae bacterium]
MSSLKERKTFMSSELSRNSAEVFKAAEEEPISITRRDGDSLVLMTEAENESRNSLLNFAAQLIVVTVDEDGRSLGERFTDRFEWMLVLSKEDREQCAKDLIKAARASFATNTAHLAIAELTSWKMTAEAIADGLDKLPPVEYLEEFITVERPR